MAHAEIIHYSVGALPLLPLPVVSGFVSDLKRRRPAEKVISAAVLSTLAVLAPVVVAAPVVPVSPQEIRTPTVEVPPRPENAVVAAVVVTVEGQQEIRRPQEDRGPPLIDSPTIVAPFDEAKIAVDQGHVRRPPVPRAARPVSDLPIVVAVFDAAEAPIAQGLIRRPDVVRPARPVDVPAVVFVLFEVPTGQDLIRRPEVVRAARPADVPAPVVVAPFDAGGAIPQGAVRRPAAEPVARPFPQEPVPAPTVIDPGAAGAIAQFQLILGVPEHRPPYALLFDNTSASFPSAVGILTTEETLNTFLTGYVGIPGTKYRFRIRQIEGSAELQTVASRSVVRAKFYPRSRLLAANAMVQVIDNPGHDASLERQAASVPRIFDFLRTRESGSTGSANAHICFEFDVSAFAGILYRSVKLRLTNEDSLRENVLFNSSFRLTRIIRPWALSTEDVTWNQYDRNLVAPLGNWSTGGGRGIDDRAESVTWAPSFPFPFETGTITESPDITVLVNAAIVNNAGILKLMVQKVNQSSGSSEINDFHSSRAPGIEEVNKPHLFFNAF